MTEEKPSKKTKWSLWLSLSFAVPFLALAGIQSLVLPGEYLEIASISGIVAFPILAVCVFFLSAVSPSKWILPGFLSGFLFAGGAIASLIAAEGFGVHNQSYDPDIGHLLSTIPGPVTMCGLPAGLISLCLAWLIRKSIKAGWWTPGGPHQ
ncbi:MAG: hypothetical protein KGZ39_05845 [Simkania sp.]|nr:hypothetical protein [Simkania sp.]